MRTEMVCFRGLIGIIELYIGLGEVDGSDRRRGHPWVSKNLLNAHPLILVFFEHAFKQLKAAGMDSLETLICVLDFHCEQLRFMLLRVADRVEGQVRADKSVQDDAEAPDISLKRRWLLLKNLRSHEGNCASALLSGLARLELSRKAEVANLHSRFCGSIADEDV